MFRQGDVLIVPSTIPANADTVLPQGRIVLALGETTGHAHAITRTDIVTELSAAGVTYLRVIETAPLVHEEHAPIMLPPGEYRVIRQREYTPSEIRTVAD